MHKCGKDNNIYHKQNKYVFVTLLCWKKSSGYVTFRIPKLIFGVALIHFLYSKRDSIKKEVILLLKENIVAHQVNDTSSLSNLKLNHISKFILASTVASVLVACGGGGSAPEVISSTPVVTVPVVTTPVGLPPASSLKDLCLVPRSGTSDKQGTLDQEKAYLRSFVDETYLWYKDVPTLNPTDYTTPQKYFDALKSPAKTASGRNVDEFHWSVTEASFDQQTAGIEEGYGIQWATAKSSPPRDWVVANMEPESPSKIFKRGDKLKSVDGEDFVNGGDVTKLNEGLFPTKLVAHTFEVIRGTETLSFTITPALISTTPVRYTKVIDTPTGKVGYMYFDDHIAKSEPLLIAAINTLKAGGAKDLVLDLRYNGGGLISIASRISYMIGGNNTTGKNFNNLVYNDKRKADNFSFPFYTYASSSAGGANLPTLDLKKVYVLVGNGTASASEAIINGLRGVDVEVILVGETTRGKPYGFVPQDNCAWVYYTVQFKGENNKGFSDFADGFAPTCTVKDDYTKDLGDTTEKRFAAALQYRDTKICPAATGSIGSLKGASEGPNYYVKPNPLKELLIPR
jgi:carboxyl-terminal processing protease